MGVKKTVQSAIPDPNIIHRIGNTPIIELSRIAEGNAPVHAKLEWYNPFGSLKDRAVIWMIKQGEKEGHLIKGKSIIVEPTSGNTGIALAGIGNVLGYQIEIVIPSQASSETKSILHHLGAQLLETDDDLCPRVGKGTDQSIALASSLVESYPGKYFMPNQYENEANFRAHYESTGPEIWQANPEISHFVTGIGTGGSITGIAQFLKEQDSNIKVIAVTPQPGHHIQGLRNLRESSMPKLLEQKVALIDEWIEVSDTQAFAAVRAVADNENLFIGPSSGAVLHACLEISRRRGTKSVVGIFADDGRKFGSVYNAFGVFTPEEFENLRTTAKHLPAFFVNNLMI